jgi:RNA polymerase sigma-70 factor (ECF subfamily)
MDKLAHDHEQRLRELFDAGHLEEVATLILESYAPEIFNFLAARLRAPAKAHEAFSMFCEDLWVGLPKFAWRCSARTWCYTLARNAATRYASARHNRASHNVALTCPRIFSELVAQVRTTTPAYQRTDVKDRFRVLRDKLDVEDQTLLMLRIDRAMSWREIALTLSGDVDLPEAIIARESARLRKAFERVKAEVKLMALKDGLLGT